MGLWCTNFALGGMIAGVVAGLAAEHGGWRMAFFVPAGILAAICVAFAILQADRPEDVGLPSPEQAAGEVESVIVAGERVAIHRVDTPFVADDLSEGHRHVTSACANVDTGPTRADAQSIEGSGQGPAVDVVTQSSKLHTCTVVTVPNARRAGMVAPCADRATAIVTCADGDGESR
jgi:hypothetical protein